MKPILIMGLALVLAFSFGCKPKTPANQPAGGTPPAGMPESTQAPPETTMKAPDPAPMTEATFSKDVQPLFSKRCANSSCHGAAKSAGMQLSEGKAYANIVSVASSENPKLMRVKPGDPDNSWLVMKIEGKQDFGSRMPLTGGPLEEKQIQTIRSWIEAGAKQD